MIGAVVAVVARLCRSWCSAGEGWDALVDDEEGEGAFCRRLVISFRMLNRYILVSL